MEAASSCTVTHSLALSPRARTARSPSPNSCPFSSAGAPSPRASPLRRARSDLDAFTRSAVLRHSPVPPILESPDDEREYGLLDGAGAGRNGPGCPGRRGGGDGGCGMGEYYRRVLRVDPENPLLLRNYGAYLHEVERDLSGAEACYARALLAAPGDADLLSLYGRVIWEARHEKERAEGYLERAVQAAPDDCYVLGSYASFLWDADEETAPAQKDACPRAELSRSVDAPAGAYLPCSALGLYHCGSKSSAFGGESQK